MTEREHAARLARQVLDRADADPDDDLSILARQLLRAIEPLTVHIVTRKHEVVSVHASHDEAYEDMDVHTERGARPDLDYIYSIESWLVQDERNLTDEQHADAVAKGFIPARRARR